MEEERKRSNEEAFREAMIRADATSKRSTGMRLPWESNSWLRMTLPGIPTANFMSTAISSVLENRVVLPPLLQEVRAEEAVKTGAFRHKGKYQQALEKLMKAKFKDQTVGDDIIRQHSLARWKVIINTSPDSFSYAFKR